MCLFCMPRDPPISTHTLHHLPPQFLVLESSPQLRSDLNHHNVRGPRFIAGSSSQNPPLRTWRACTLGPCSFELLGTLHPFPPWLTPLPMEPMSTGSTGVRRMPHR